MPVRAQGTAYVAWPDITVYLRLMDVARHAQWLNPGTIVRSAKAAMLCNAASSPAVTYVSRVSKKDDEVAIFLHLVMRSENTFPDTVGFLKLTMTKVVYYETKNTRVHRRGARTPDGLEGPVGLLTPVLEALFSNFNRLVLLDIARDLRCGEVAKSTGPGA